MIIGIGLLLVGIALLILHFKEKKAENEFEAAAGSNLVGLQSP
ncbi:MAG: hypothetical protein ACI9P5_004098 [Saprospiraceae bacterium]